MLNENKITDSSLEYNITIVDSKELFNNRTVIRIVHGGAIYFLRITKGNKLILTK